MKTKHYYLFWAAIALIITVVMTASVVGLQVWMTNQKESCPMRTIMSDHSSFGEVLKDLGKSGYGDNRQYGNYGGQ